MRGCRDSNIVEYPTGNNRHCNANDGMFYNDSGTKISDIRDGNVLFAEGSVHFISNTISLPTFKAMATIKTGDLVDQEKAGF